MIYRFPQIQFWNGKELRESDRIKAKIEFQNFDKILQIPEKQYSNENIRNYGDDLKKDKQYIKLL